MPWRLPQRQGIVEGVGVSSDEEFEAFLQSPRPEPPLSLKSEAELLALAIELIAPIDERLARYIGCTIPTATRYRANPGSIPIADRMLIYGVLEFARFHLFHEGTVDARLELLYEALSGRLRSRILECRRRSGRDPYRRQ